MTYNIHVAFTDGEALSVNKYVAVSKPKLKPIGDGMSYVIDTVDGGVVEFNHAFVAYIEAFPTQREMLTTYPKGANLIGANVSASVVHMPSLNKEDTNE